MRVLPVANALLLGAVFAGCGSTSTHTDADTGTDSGGVDVGEVDAGDSGAHAGDSGSEDASMGGGALGDSSFGSGLWTIEFLLPGSDEPEVIELAVAPALGVYRQCVSVSGQPYRCGEAQPTASLLGDVLVVTLFNGSFSGEVSEDGLQWTGDGTATACGGCTFAFTAERTVSGAALTFVPL